MSEDGTVYELMSLPDLVQAKKTQRDKDVQVLFALKPNRNAVLFLHGFAGDAIKAWSDFQRANFEDFLERYFRASQAGNAVNVLLRAIHDDQNACLSAPLGPIGGAPSRRATAWRRRLCDCVRSFSMPILALDCEICADSVSSQRKPGGVRFESRIFSSEESAVPKER